MRTIKRLFVFFVAITIIVLLFRGWFYRHLVTYKSVGQRTNYLAESQLIAHINAQADEYNDAEIEKIIKIGLAITSKQLHFTAQKNENDPNKLITSKTAHCVGYASSEYSKMQNQFIQFFKYLYLSIKIMGIVAGGHGSTKT